MGSHFCIYNICSDDDTTESTHRWGTTLFAHSTVDARMHAHHVHGKFLLRSITRSHHTVTRTVRPIKAYILSLCARKYN